MIPPKRRAWLTPRLGARVALAAEDRLEPTTDVVDVGERIREDFIRDFRRAVFFLGEL